jgi:DNA invertase Pin-like site-specific DNA recombinase
MEFNYSKPHTAIYTRVSTEEQTGGLSSQNAELESYCKGHQLEPYCIYPDLGHSGKSLKRPYFETLQDGIKAGLVNTVVVWKLDRLSRKLRDGIVLLHDWLEQGVRVVAVAQQLDFSGPVGRMIAALLFGLAEIERAGILENQQRGIKAAMKKACPRCGKDGQGEGMRYRRNVEVRGKKVERWLRDFVCLECGNKWTGRCWGGYLGERRPKYGSAELSAIKTMLESGMSLAKIHALTGISNNVIYSNLGSIKKLRKKALAKC